MRSAGGRSRALDWWCTALITGLGGTFLLPGSSLAFPGLDRLLDLLSEEGWGILAVGVGLVRLTALVINGRAYEGSPIIRAIGAAIGAALWMEFAVVFLDISIRTGALAPGVWVNLCFAGADFHNVIRASRDAIHARRARELAA